MNRRPSIDLRHLEILRALVETGKTTIAAQRLGTSQSAVSRGIAQLEAQLGRMLFDRQGGRLVPTAEAFALNEQVQPALAVLDTIGEDGVPRPVGGFLRLGAPTTLAHCFLQSRVATFIRQNREVEISFDVMPSDALIASIAEERIDLGLTDTIPAHVGVRSELLLATEAVCILPAGHRLARKRTLTAPDLAGELQVSPGCAVADQNGRTGRQSFSYCMPEVLAPGWEEE